MIKVLRKAFDILEIISMRDGEAVFSGEIASELGLNQATCSRIMQDLVEFGYLKQVAPKKGYILGTMAFALSDGGVFQRDLTEIARPLVKDCAESIQESTLLATFHNGKRYILAHHNGNPEIEVIVDKPYYLDLYSTATGRLLLAFAELKALKSYFERQGLPEHRWPEVDSMDALERELERIRREKIHLKEAAQTTAISFPIYKEGRVIAALGISLLNMNFQDDRREMILMQGRDTAKLISERL